MHCNTKLEHYYTLTVREALAVKRVDVYMDSDGVEFNHTVSDNSFLHGLYCTEYYE